MSSDIRVEHRALVDVIEKALAAEGVPPEVRRVEAELTAQADLLGVPSHGVRTLPLVIRSIRAGAVNPAPQPRLLRDNLATCLLDGDQGLGRFVSAYGMDLAIDRARRYGLGLCVVRRAAHWGRAHAYAYQAARGHDWRLHDQRDPQHDRLGFDTPGPRQQPARALRRRRVRALIPSYWTWR